MTNQTAAPLSTPKRGEGPGVRLYFTKLYRYHKGLFACIAFFGLVQLVVFYKKGMLVSPWYNYGMYSAKVYPQQVFEVNKQLTGPSWLYLLSPQRDDKVNLTLDAYRNSPTNDSLYQKEITRIIPMLRLPAPAARFYHHQFTQQQFNTWFKNYTAGFGNPLSQMVMQPVTPQKVVWDGSKLVPLQNNHP